MIAILGALVPVISDVLRRVIPDANEAAKVQAELTKALIENQGALNTAMADVMKSDAQSEGFLTRNARPAAVIWGLAMVTWVGVVAPMLGIQRETIAALNQVPADLWNLITVGIGGYMLAKTADSAVKVFAGKAK